MSSRYTSSDEAWVYLNFYSEFEDFNRYKGYAIVHYTRDSLRDSRTPDEFFIRDSLRLCRDEFTNAYRHGTLTRWDVTKKDLVSFSPQFVAVIVDDKQGTVPQSGIIVTAKRLFSDEEITKVMESGTVSRGKLWYDDISEEEKAKGYSPGKVVRYAHIDKHIGTAPSKIDVESTPQTKSLGGNSH